VTSTVSLLAHVTGLLESAGIPYMVAGSFASTFYSSPRTTADMDIVIDPGADALDRLLAGLDPARFYVDADTARDALRRRGMFNAIDMESGWKIDFVIRKARPFSIEEMSRRRRAHLFGADVFVASPEDVIVSKLEWATLGGSARQLRDVAEVLAAQQGVLDLAYIEGWVAAMDLGAAWDAARAAPP
jgi:hypothetical protein